MSARPSCPDPARLQELLDGQLRDPQQAELSRHLDTCVDCQQTLEELAAGARPWAEAAGGLARQPAAESALERAIAELKGSASETVTLAASTGARDLELAFLSPAENPEHLGRLGPYEVHEVLGRGGMGVVLKAFEPALRRFVAIKLLGSHLAANAVHRQRFLREARSAAAVRHEHVVGIHRVDDSGALPFLVMEYVPGRTLQQRLDEGPPLELNEIVDLGLQIAAGLAAAHAQGVVHRDIKPANVLLEAGTGRVKIADFGLARAADDTGLTQSGVIAGTPQYMAPEQARGEKVDHRADLFSLGSILYALCTGRAPFQGGAAVAVLYQVCSESPTPIREINPAIPEWLAALVEKLQAKKPGDRFQTAAEVAELLRRYQAHLREPARFAAPPTPQPPPASQSPAELPANLKRVIGYEYRSQKTFGGWPLVHVATGFDPTTGKKRIAKGIIAIGDMAIGVVALGGVALGGAALGGCAVGLIALGGVGIGLLIALGGGAIGSIAIGGGAFGLVAIGGGAVGYYAFGGGAIGVHPLDANQVDPKALEFFSSWLGDWVRQLYNRSR
jgi:eukaryotic-like serine/threonine-protein kinase